MSLKRFFAAMPAALATIVLAAWAGFLVGPATWASAATAIVGQGSSFAYPEVAQWVSDVGQAPYNLPVNYTSSSSGDGRFEFANQTVDFGVTDIPYQPAPFDSKSPSFPFDYIPVTAGGLAFMYHINGLSKTLQLSSYSACAVMTGAVGYWDDPIIKADNPGVSLPHTKVEVVTRSDLAGTNFVLQEYCIHEQPSLWASFVNSPTIQDLQNQVSDLSATSPRSDWPLFPAAIPVNGSTTAADTVANPDNNGYITAVETAYAKERNTPVASVKNASGVYTQPTATGVASALAYATQQPDGIHVLNFDGTGKYVYNPSTYSYLITPTSGWNAAKGATLSAFVNYDLTKGQIKAPEIGFASLGLSLEQYGITMVGKEVPGAVAPTAAEQASYACGDFTVPEVQAGDSSPCPTTTATQGGGTTATTPPTTAKSTTPTTGRTTPTTTAKGVTSKSVASTATSGATRSALGAEGSGNVASSSSATTGSVDPSVSLSAPTAPLASTGANPAPAVALGVFLLAVGWFGRRRIVLARHRARTR